MLELLVKWSKSQLQTNLLAEHGRVIHHSARTAKENQLERYTLEWGVSILERYQNQNQKKGKLINMAK